MNSIDINGFLSQNAKTKKLFGGVFASDEFAKLDLRKFRKPCVVVVNTDPSYKPGVHWVAFYIASDENKSLEFFDSFGQTYEVYSKYFSMFIRRYKYKRCVQSDVQLQSNISAVCGHYCCLYALYKSDKFTLSKFKKLFKGYDLMQNDKIALKLFKKYFKGKMSSKRSKLCYPIQKCFPQKSIKRLIKKF